LAIFLKGITKSFPSTNSWDSVPVLDGIDLDVPDGKIIALFGPNGCGKTTLLNIIAHVEAPDHGQVALDGPDGERLAVG